jgi:hypothetical protein
MKGFKNWFEEEMTATGAVAGAGDDSSTVPVYLDKKKKKKPEIVKRFEKLEMTIADRQREKTKSQQKAHQKRMMKSARDSIKKYEKSRSK